MSEELSEGEVLILKYLRFMGGSVPVYYLDSYTVKKGVIEGKRPDEISKEIDENPNSPDKVIFGPIMAEELNSLTKKGYIQGYMLYVGLTKKGEEALKKIDKRD